MEKYQIVCENGEGKGKWPCSSGQSSKKALRVFSFVPKTHGKWHRTVGIVGTGTAPIRVAFRCSTIAVFPPYQLQPQSPYATTTFATLNEMSKNRNKAAVWC